ncbi:MAG: RDD family protein [Acidimicrobiaceae bacterium]|nr:RDD family protein [Acidimicrobiaceae bacterium]
MGRLFYDSGSSNSSDNEPLVPDQLPDLDGSNSPRSDSNASKGASTHSNASKGQNEPSGFDPTWDIPYFMDEGPGSGFNMAQNVASRPQIGIHSRPGIELQDGFHPYAGFWRRFLALMIDGMMLTAVFELTLSINNAKTTGSSVVSFLINLVYFTLLLGGPSGQSVGCKLTKIKLLAVDGTVAGYPKALLRQLYSIISGLTFLLGYLMMLFTPRRQTLHDLMARTIVVDVRTIGHDS